MFMSKKANLTFSLSGVYICLFCYVGIYLPFWGIWLSSKGLSATEISLLLAFPQVMKVAISPFIMQLSDKTGMLKFIFTLFIALSSFFWVFYFYVEGFGQILLVSILVNIFLPNSMPMMESLTLREVKKHKLNYGLIRALGSLAFIFASVIFGGYLENHSLDNIPEFAFYCLLAGLFLALLLPRDQKKIKAINDNKSKNSPLVDLMTNSNFLVFISVATLLHMSHGFFYSLGSVYWKDVGFDEGTIGYLWAVGVAAEVFFFLFGTKLVTKLRPIYLFITISLVGVIRWVIMAETTNLTLLLFIQIFHGITFGATHLASMYFISTRVPEKFLGTAQGLYAAVPMGVGTGIAMYISGFLYNEYNSFAYYVMAFFCVISFFISFKLKRLSN